MINRRNMFDRSIKMFIEEHMITFKTLPTGQGDDYPANFLLDYPYLSTNYETIVIDLSKQQALDANLKTIQQIHFTRTLDQSENTTIPFIIEEELDL